MSYYESVYVKPEVKPTLELISSMHDRLANGDPLSTVFVEAWEEWLKVTKQRGLAESPEDFISDLMELSGNLDQINDFVTRLQGLVREYLKDQGVHVVFTKNCVTAEDMPDEEEIKTIIAEDMLRQSCQ